MWLHQQPAVMSEAVEEPLPTSRQHLTRSNPSYPVQLVQYDGVEPTEVPRGPRREHLELGRQ